METEKKIDDMRNWKPEEGEEIWLNNGVLLKLTYFTEKISVGGNFYLAKNNKGEIYRSKYIYPIDIERKSTTMFLANQKTDSIIEGMGDHGDFCFFCDKALRWCMSIEEAEKWLSDKNKKYNLKYMAETHFFPNADINTLLKMRSDAYLSLLSDVNNPDPWESIDYCNKQIIKTLILQ